MRRIRRGWYYVRSFFHKTWTLADYPVVVREQRAGEASASPPEREFTTPAFVATIDGMFVSGFGNTPEAARAELAQRFEVYRAVLPRPGTQQRLRLASTERIAAFGPLRDEFLERVLRMGTNIFVSDESVLGLFPEELEEYERRIILLYGIDVDQLPDERLVTILDAIARRKTLR